MSASPDPPTPLHFAPSLGRTVGVEWEIGLVDPDSLDLVPKGRDLVALVEAGEQNHWRSGTGRSMITKELLTNTVEIVSGVCENAPGIAIDLADGLARVRAAADAVGVDLFGGGSHPFARWEDQQVTDGDRYETLIDRTQWWGRQMLIFGVHVHVGVTSAAKVWPLINALLTYHPHLTALTASSPYWTGEDTGYASNRTMLFQQLPTAGLPFQFQTWSAYRGYLRDVFTTGVVQDATELRWDIRPSLRFGTIEVRCSDGLASLEEVAALTAFIHCLTLHLEAQLDNGTLPPPLPPWHVQENKWRAARYGLEAIVITDADSTQMPVTDDLARLLERLAPTARRLECEAELAGIERILSAGAGYQRMRAAVRAGNGDVREAARAMLIR